MEQGKDINNELELQISVSAAPAISFGAGTASALPAEGEDGFFISMEGQLQYSALSRILNELLSGRRFDLSDGLIPVHVVVQKVAVGGDDGGNLLLKVQFTGSFGGAVLLKGKPIYNETDQSVEMANMNYDLQSKSILLNSAKWLLNDKIVSEIKKRSRVPIASYIEAAKSAIEVWLNSEWAKGIIGNGTVGDLAIDGVAAAPEHLTIKGHCSGSLRVRVSVPALGK